MIPTPAQKAHSDAIQLAFQELGDQRVTVSTTRKPFPEPSIQIKYVLEEKKE